MNKYIYYFTLNILLYIILSSKTQLYINISINKRNVKITSKSCALLKIVNLRKQIELLSFTKKNPSVCYKSKF